MRGKALKKDSITFYEEEIRALGLNISNVMEKRRERCTWGLEKDEEKEKKFYKVD